MKKLVLEWKRYLKEADLTSVAPASNAQTPPISSTPAVKSSENGDDLLKKQEAKKALLDLQSAIANIQTQATKLQTALQEAKKRKRAKVTKKKKSGDRCTRIAKRKYDVWPSAYASGAVVKCRQGKIWKGISESATDEEIDDALLLEEVQEIEIIEEKWTEKYKRSIDCKNPKGFSQKAHCQGKKKK